MLWQSADQKQQAGGECTTRQRRRDAWVATTTPLLPLLLLLLLWLEGAQAACNFTVWDVLNARSASFETVLRLKDSSYDIANFLSDPYNTVTIFAPTDAGVLNSLRIFNAKTEDVGVQLTVDLLAANDSLYNIISLYHLLPTSAWDANALLASGHRQTALGLLLGEDYSLKFDLDDDGLLSVSSLSPYNVTVLETVTACNGYLHMIDKMLMPPMGVTDAVDAVDTAWSDLPQLQPARCNSTFLQAALTDSVVGEHIEALLAAVPGLERQLDVLMDGALLLPTRDALQLMLDGEVSLGVGADELLLYSHVGATCCPPDFLREGSMPTSLSEATGQTLLVEFYLRQDRKVAVVARDPQRWSGVVQAVRTVCDVVVYLHDAPVATQRLPVLGDSTDVGAYLLSPLPQEGEKMPPPFCAYPITTDALPDYEAYITAEDVYTGSDAEDNASGNGSSVSVVAIAVPVAVGVMLLLAALVALVLLLVRQRRMHAAWTTNRKDQRRPNEDGSVIATEDLMVAVARAASGTDFGKVPSKKRRNQLLYQKTASLYGQQRTAVPMAESAVTPSDDATPSFTPSVSWNKEGAWLGGGGCEGWEVFAEELEYCTRPGGERWLLGEGSCGTVYKGIRGGVQDVAIKVLGPLREPPSQGASSATEQRARLYKEIEVLKGCRDRNIVQFYGACEPGEGELMLVTEYLAGGDLFHAMRDEATAARFRWRARGQHVALDVARALCYLHSRKICHADVKSPNILLAEDGTAKLADMGLSQALHPVTCSASMAHGTYVWAAPEALLDMRINEKADMYSFGVVLWELVTGLEPHRGNLRDVVTPDECPDEIADLIDACLRVAAQERPSAREAFRAIKGSIEAEDVAAAQARRVMCGPVQ